MCEALRQVNIAFKKFVDDNQKIIGNMSVGTVNYIFLSGFSAGADYSLKSAQNIVRGKK